MSGRDAVSVFTRGASKERASQSIETLRERSGSKVEVAYDDARDFEVKRGTDTNEVSALDNTVSNLSALTQQDLQNRRSARYARRNALWRITSQNRIRACGRTRIAEHAGITMRKGKATYSGLATCGSVWSCPVCSAKILTRRSAEVRKAIHNWGTEGNYFAFQTLTMRHKAGQSLKELWAGLSYAWQTLNSGRAAKTEAKRYGQAGFIRVVEVTHGKNGWHVHIHLLRFLERKLTSNELEEWSNSQFDRWSKALMRKGFASPLKAAQDFKLSRNANDLADYLTKQADQGRKLSKEMTSNETKQAKRGGRKPWDILDDLAESPNSRDLGLWREYEVVSTGKKQLHWSVGLRSALGLGEEESDELLAVEDDHEASLIVSFTDDGLKKLVSNSNWHSGALSVAENQGLVGLIEFLNFHDIEHKIPIFGTSPTRTSLECIYLYRR